MRKEKEGIFRGSALSWYDSDKICLVTMVFVAVVNFFGWSGISTAFSKPEWMGYWHLPAILLVASSFVFLSVIRRLIVRHLLKKTRDSDIFL